MTARLPRQRLTTAQLRGRTLDAARAQRAVGHALPEVEPISTVEAFRRAAASLDATLAALSPADWSTTVLRGLTVQQLLGHLVAVEHDTADVLAGGSEFGRLDHVESTQPTALAQDLVEPSVTLDTWRRAIRETVARATAVSDEGGVYRIHGLALSFDGLLIIRAFEFWTHENDIRARLELARCEPDASTLAHMCVLAVHSIPYSAYLGRVTDPVDLRLVLTGAGGGTWNVPINTPGDSLHPVRVVADATAFCRLAANRITAADLHADVRGDPAVAERVLTAVNLLALD